MDQLPAEIADLYMRLLERAIIDLRSRIRYDDNVTLDEVHDYLDSLHNIPAMLRGDGGWFNPGNIDADLQRFDSKWLKSSDAAERRKGLFALLQSIRAGENPDDA